MSMTDTMSVRAFSVVRHGSIREHYLDRRGDLGRRWLLHHLADVLSIHSLSGGRWVKLGSVTRARSFRLQQFGLVVVEPVPVGHLMNKRYHIPSDSEDTSRDCSELLSCVLSTGAVALSSHLSWSDQVERS
jgi:hypothetical protein